MRVPTNNQRSGVGFNMTPMIDVVFLLIIFFLVTSHLAQQESQLELDLPEARSGRSPTEDGMRRVVINVLPEEQPDRRIQVGGRTMGQPALRTLIDFENRKAKEEEIELQVRIRTHRKVPYRVVEPIMVACVDAGVWNVTFAVLEK